MNLASRLAGLALLSLAPSASAAPLHWVSSWQASPQPVWGTDFLFPSLIPSTLDDQSFRQTARLSLGGQRVRIRLSNAHGDHPLRIGAAALAAADGGTPVALQFDGRPGSVIAPGGDLLSDPLALPLADLQAVQVSVHLPAPTPLQTFHWEGRQTSWIAPGNQTGAPILHSATPTTARLLLSGIEVEAAASAATVVVIGDSITDGATASLDRDQRWTDHLATRLASRGVAVANAGISGGRLLRSGMGDAALARFERDVLRQPGVTAVIVLIGINDISWAGTAFAPDQPRPTLAELQAGYRSLVRQAHAHGLRVTGATLPPFAGALPGTPLDDYFSVEKDALRIQLNDWIRQSDAFDTVLDLDQALRDPAAPQRLLPRYDSGDHLHPGDAGNRAMAEAVDLEALLPAPAGR